MINRLHTAESSSLRIDAGSETYPDMYDFAPAGYLTLDCDGIIHAADLTGDILFGISRSHLISRRFEDFISKDTRPSLHALMSGLCAAGYPRGSCDVEIVNEGQLPLYVHIDGMAVATGNGLQIRIAVVDVTERKQAEDVLRALEMKYRRLLENLQGVYFETTLAGVIQEVSPSISGVFGFPREEVIGKSIMDFYANSFHRDLHLDMILKNGKVTNYETEFIYKGGTHHWVSITSTLLFQSDGAPYGIIGSIRDVTDRKQKEMELQIKDSAISTSIYGIAFVDLDGKIIYVNPSFIDMWGYDAEKDVIDRPLNDIFQTDQPVLNIADYLLEKGNKGAEMTAVRNDHSLFTAQVSASLIKDTTGNPLCINVSFLDISVRKEMEDIMIRQEKLSSLGQLSAGLAHELRNPLAVISSCAQFSIENLSMGRLVKENLQMIYRNSQRASNLINNLLAFSRPSDLAQRLLNINDMFLRMADMARLETTPCRIEFENQLAPDLPLVTGDEDKLGQVFLNILINAIQAVGGKGKIIMKTAFQPNRRQVEAAVIDNGPGIPEEYRQRIFDPFFTTKDGGTGLGLSISFSIIQQHNGTIVAEPNTGGGTRISVMLPATFQSVDRKETNHAD